MDFAIPRGGTGRDPITLHQTIISLYRGSISELCASAFGSSLLFGVNNFMRKIFHVKNTDTEGEIILSTDSIHILYIIFYSYLLLLL